jgi:hypothetical protein
VTHSLRQTSSVSLFGFIIRNYSKIESNEQKTENIQKICNNYEAVFNTLNEKENKLKQVKAIK